MNFSAMYEPQSLDIIERFTGWQQHFAPYLQQAGTSGAQDIIDAIPQVTTWEHSTGRLDTSFYIMQSTPYNIIFGSDIPYAARRNFSFKGPDSLGRMFPRDPAAHYIEAAETKASPSIEERYLQAITNAWDSIGGGA